MNKLLLLLLFSFSFGLTGCSSLELGDAMSSEQYTQKILDLGLSHEENLIEASKLKTPHLVSVVSLQLTNARDERIQDEIDFQESEKLAKLVNVSADTLTFNGSEVSKSITTGVLVTDVDLHNFYLKGVKNPNTGFIQNKLYIKISHNSKSKREYLSANECDQWGRCEGEIHKFSGISVNASNCTSYSCDFTEAMELNLSDDYLKNSVESGFTLFLNSKKKNHKLKVSKSYVNGFLMVAK